MEDDGIFYGHILRSFVMYILRTFGTVRGNLVSLFPFWYFVTRKIWQPCSAAAAVYVLCKKAACPFLFPRFEQKVRKLHTHYPRRIFQQFLLD
jgi:hypothetical protein